MGMKISSDEQSAPMAIENFKILGAILELPAKQPCQPADSPHFFGELAGLAGLFGW